MRRPTNTQFAVAAHVLVLIVAADGRPISSDEMARSVQASPVYLRRVLGRLRAGGLVSSRPGPHGGWLLTRPPAAITLGDVWRAVHGDDPVLGLHGPAEACPVGAEIGGLMVGIQDRITRAIEHELDQTTLADASVPGIVAAASA
jgi:Rrf2 family protein